MKHYDTILIVGSGGREHSIGWKLLQDTTKKIFFAPKKNRSNFGRNCAKNVRKFGCSAFPDRPWRTASCLSEREENSKQRPQFVPMSNNGILEGPNVSVKKACASSSKPM